MKVSVYFLFCLFLFTSNSTYAQNEVIFDNDSGDGLWNNPINWEHDEIPDFDEVARIPSSTTVTIPVGYTAKPGRIVSEGSVTLFGTITISNVDNNYAIDLVLTSSNLSIIGGQINLDKCAGGIHGNGNLSLSLGSVVNVTETTGTLSRRAITVGDLDVNVGSLINIHEADIALEFKGSFENDGDIIISNSNVTSISVGLISTVDPNIPNGDLINNGMIEIDGFYTLINIDHPCTNYGEMHLSNNQWNTALLFIQNFDFINEGVLTVSSPGSQFGIVPNTYELINRNCGVIRMNGVGINTQMENEGVFYTDAWKDGPLENDGVLFYSGLPFGSDMNGGYSGNPQSDGIIVTEEDGIFEVEVAASDFWIDESPNAAPIVEELFVDEALTISAGELFVNDVWEPSLDAGGEKIFFFQPDLPGCTDDPVLEYDLGSIVKSGDNIWNGDEGDELWINPGNWSLGHVPTDSEFAIISDPNAIVKVDQSSASALHVENNGELAIAEGYKLSISDSPISGLLNTATGKVLIDGELFVFGGKGIGFESLSTIGNKITGEVLITDNNSPASMQVRGITNFGDINISNSEVSGLRISSTGEFVNDGVVNISDSAIGIWVSGEVINNSDIIINNSSQNGIRCFDRVTNNASASLTIDNSNEFALRLLSDVVFDNYGEVIIRGVEEPNDIDENGSIYFNGTVNGEATFNNHACAILEHSEYIEMQNGSTFTNEGSIISLGEVTHTIEPSFVNNGTLVNNSGSWDGIFLSNNNLVITPKNITAEVGDEIEEIFTADSQLYSFGSFYVDAALTMPAGYYNPETNSWKIASNALGNKRFYVPVDYTGCSKYAYFDLDANVTGDCGLNQWTGGQDVWSNASKWSLGRVPSVCDDVIIAGVSDVFMDIDETTINSIQISGASFTVDLGNTLNLNGYYNHGMLVESMGSATNNGAINLDLANNGISVTGNGTLFNNKGTVSGSSLFTMFVLLDVGLMINSPSGIMTVEEYEHAPQGGFGIDVAEDGCNFTNEGILNLSDFQSGIRVDDLGEFENTTNAQTIIDESSEEGIVLTNEGVFNNSGSLEVTNSGSNGISISTDASLSNSDGAMMEIYFTDDDGIHIFDAGVLINNGTLLINNILGNGIYNQSNFTTGITGETSVLSLYAEHGIKQDITSSRYTNHGTTHIYRSMVGAAPVLNFNGAKIFINNKEFIVHD